MKIKEIRELARMVREEGLESLEVTEGELHICLRARTAGAAAASVLSPAAQPAPDEPAVPTVPAAPRGKAVASPMVGVFYSAASPEAKPYVRAGQTVKKGDVLCIIEAMKLMNEICAEQDGVIAEICAENGQMVEFGQPLFYLA